MLNSNHLTDVVHAAQIKQCVHDCVLHVLRHHRLRSQLTGRQSAGAYKVKVSTIRCNPFNCELQIRQGKAFLRNAYAYAQVLAW